MNTTQVLSELQFLDKYSRFDYQKGRRENWQETVTRVTDFLLSYLPEKERLTVGELLFNSILNKEVSPSMRLMATAGEAARLNEASIFNCSYLPLESTQDFHDLTLLLGLGVGVGFSVENHFVGSLGMVKSQVKERTVRFVVPDSIYGWAQSIKYLLENKMAGNRVHFDYSLIRPAGSPLKTRGGRASGPEPLMDAHIAIGRVLDERAGKEIRSIDAFDIACHIAGAIVSGGVRRCLPTGSLVHTQNGMVPIEKINIYHEVLTSNGYYPVLRKFFQGKQKVLRVVTKESSFECTGNHRIYVKEDDLRYVWKEAKNLKIGDKLHGLGMKEIPFLRIDEVEEEKDTWDLEIDSKHEFFCEGYLVHNSAMITLFDIEDQSMLDAKSGDNFSKNLQRQYANVSAVVDGELSEDEMSALVQRMHDSGFGEPGIFSRYAARQTMPERRQAVFGMGANPCCEIVLRPRQFCNLSQAIVRPDDTFDTLKRKVEIATIIGTIQSSMNHFPELHPDFAKNNSEERLLGVSLSGIMDNKVLQDADVLSRLKEFVIKTNKKWAKILGINASAAATCVKPDGNTSLLYNTSPGLHPRWSPYYIRRVRLQYNNPVAQWLMDSGVKCEPVLGETWENVRTVVFDFPIKSPESTMYQMTASAIDQLETWRLLKIHWTEHNPSVTIHYKPSELDSIKRFCYLNQDILSGVSFLENGHKYVQAPYEEIDEQTYLDSLDKFPEVDYDSFWKYETRFDSTSGTQTLACVGGACLI